MTVFRAISLTFLLFIIFNLCQVVFGIFEYRSHLFPHWFFQHIGITTPISFLIAYFILFKFFWKRTFNFPKPLILAKIDLKIIAYLCLIAVSFQFLNRPFWDLDRIYNYVQDIPMKNFVGTSDGFTLDFFYSSISILILSPILEELFFRKFIMEKLLQKNSQIVALIVSSLCFAFIHIETPFNIIPAFLFGIVSGLIFIKTRWIGYSMILHLMINLLVQIFNLLNQPDFKWLLQLNFNFTYWLICLLGAVLTLFSLKEITFLSGSKINLNINKKHKK